jgi:glutamine synthetase
MPNRTMYILLVLVIPRRSAGTKRPLFCMLNRTMHILLVSVIPRRSAGTPWELCPRSMFRRLLAAAERVHGITFKFGFESEFVLLEAADLLKPEGPDGPLLSHYARSNAFDSRAEGVRLINMTGTLQDM